MAKKKSKSKSRQARGTAQPPTQPLHAFTESEEAFFRAGDTLTDLAPVAAESFDDLDTGYQRPGLLRRLFSRAA